MKDIIITAETIEAWEKEAEELQRKIDQDTRRFKFIKHRLSAVRLLVKDTEGIYEENEDIGVIFEELSPSNAILTVLSNSKEATMSPGELREAVTQAGYPEERWGNNFAYFYTVLNRLFEAGKIHRDADDRYFMPMKAVEGSE